MEVRIRAVPFNYFFEEIEGIIKEKIFQCKENYFTIFSHNFLSFLLRRDEKLLWSAMAMGMKPVARLFKVVLPSALPDVLLGCRVGLAMALIVMISSEMIARQSGAGDLLFNALDMALYGDVYAMIVILAAIGFVLDWVFERVRRRLVHWAESRQDAMVPGGGV